jgi:small subunit ribosomal protein S20
MDGSQRTQPEPLAVEAPPTQAPSSKFLARPHKSKALEYPYKRPDPPLTLPIPAFRLRAHFSAKSLPGAFVANTKSAEKAARQAEKHRAHNVTMRSRMRSAIRGVSDAIAAGKKEEAQKSYAAAVPIIDSMVNKQIVHRNKAARHKSRLAARIRGMS